MTTNEIQSIQALLEGIRDERRTAMNTATRVGSALLALLHLIEVVSDDQSGYLPIGALEGYATELWVGQQGYLTDRGYVGTSQVRATAGYQQIEGITQLHFTAPTEAGERRGFRFNGVTDAASLFYLEPTLSDDGRLRFVINDNPEDCIEMAWGLWNVPGEQVVHTFRGTGYVAGGILRSPDSEDLVWTAEPYRDNFGSIGVGWRRWHDVNTVELHSDRGWFSGIVDFTGTHVWVSNKIILGSNPGVALTWDSTNQALRVARDDGSAINLYAVGGVSALGYSSQAGGGGGMDVTTMWNALAGGTAQQINATHLQDALSGYLLKSGGTMTGDLRIGSYFYFDNDDGHCQLGSIGADNNALLGNDILLTADYHIGINGGDYLFLEGDEIRVNDRVLDIGKCVQLGILGPLVTTN